MKGIVVSLYAKTASFRDPNTHLYQETIVAPPPTTLMGLAGAALGMEYRLVLEFFKENQISVGSYIEFEGIGKDLWNYSKIAGKEVRKDILVREFLTDVRLEVFYACSQGTIVEKLCGSFQDPIFALSLGNSDELALVKQVELCDQINICKSKDVKNTWIHGNYINDFELDWGRIKNTPIKLSIKPPIIKNLPVDFDFNKNEEREAKRFEKFTFLGDFHILKTEVEVYSFNNRNIPLYTFNKEREV